MSALRGGLEVRAQPGKWSPLPRHQRRTRKSGGSPPIASVYCGHQGSGNDAMTPDNGTTVARWLKEFWGNSWNPRIINELATADIVFHHPLHEPKRGRASLTKFMTDYRG